MISVLISGESNETAIEHEAVDQLNDSVIYVDTMMANLVRTPKKEYVGGRFIILIEKSYLYLLHLCAHPHNVHVSHSIDCFESANMIAVFDADGKEVVLSWDIQFQYYLLRAFCGLN